MDVGLDVIGRWGVGEPVDETQDRLFRANEVRLWRITSGTCGDGWRCPRPSGSDRLTSLQ